MSERLVCIGDSITEGIGDERGVGWPGRLSEYLAQKHPLLWHINNLGVAGDTSLAIRNRLTVETVHRKPQRIIIGAGLNDTLVRLWPDARGPKIDIHYSRETWKDILASLKSFDVPVLILGLTPVNENRLPLVYKPFDKDDKGLMGRNSDIVAYEAILEKEVRVAGLPFLPLHQILSAEGYIDTLEDGLHPNEKGYDLLAQKISAFAETIKFFNL